MSFLTKMMKYKVETHVATHDQEVAEIEQTFLADCPPPPKKKTFFLFLCDSNLGINELM